jgi:hypothetical protein
VARSAGTGTTRLIGWHGGGLLNSAYQSPYTTLVYKQLPKDPNPNPPSPPRVRSRLRLCATRRPGGLRLLNVPLPHCAVHRLRFPSAVIYSPRSVPSDPTPPTVATRRTAVVLRRAWEDHRAAGHGTTCLRPQGAVLVPGRRHGGTVRRNSGLSCLAVFVPTAGSAAPLRPVRLRRHLFPVVGPLRPHVAASRNTPHRCRAAAGMGGPPCCWARHGMLEASRGRASAWPSARRAAVPHHPHANRRIRCSPPTRPRPYYPVSRAVPGGWAARATAAGPCHEGPVVYVFVE